MRTAAAALLLAGPAAVGHVAEFSPRSHTATEANATVRVTVRRDGPNGAGTVDWATHDLSAKAGSDYVAGSGTLLFADGDETKTFTVTLKDDTVAEDDEVFHLRLSNPTGVISDLGEDATVVISANDATSSPVPVTKSLSPSPPSTASPRPAATRSRSSSPSASPATVSPSPATTSSPSSPAPFETVPIPDGTELADPIPVSDADTPAWVPIAAVVLAVAAGSAGWVLLRRHGRDTPPTH